MVSDKTGLRLDHVGIVVDDMESVVEFFTELGLELEGQTQVEGEWVDRVVGVEGVRSAIVMLRTPDGRAHVELSRFLAPAATADDTPPAVNARGSVHLTFAVDDLDGVLGRLDAHGGGLVGEVVDYEDMYRLCYVRGPEGIVVELAQRLR